MKEKTRVDSIYEVLRERICLGKYRPGDIFHETELGREFEVSRTPIRQVLQRLSFEKLAVVRTGVGTIVEDFGQTKTGNYLEVQAKLLMTAAELDMVTTEFDFEEAAATLQVRMSRISVSPDSERFWVLLKVIQDYCSRLLADDLISHMNELLFFRCGPAVMEAVRNSPDEAAHIFQSNVDRLVTALNDADANAFIRAQSENVRNSKSLVL